MKRYFARETLQLPAGSVVELDPRQAADRALRITPTRVPDRYVLNETLDFMRGEAFGLESELPAVLAGKVESAGDQVAVTTIDDPDPVAVPADMVGAPPAPRSGKGKAKEGGGLFSGGKGK